MSTILRTEGMVSRGCPTGRSPGPAARSGAVGEGRTWAQTPSHPRQGVHRRHASWSEGGSGEWHDMTPMLHLLQCHPPSHPSQDAPTPLAHLRASPAGHRPADPGKRMVGRVLTGNGITATSIGSTTLISGLPGLMGWADRSVAVSESRADRVDSRGWRRCRVLPPPGSRARMGIF